LQGRLWSRAVIVAEKNPNPITGLFLAVETHSRTGRAAGVVMALTLPWCICRRCCSRRPSR
jgi:hypothetical protein